jgi:hypothetical protein
MDRRHSSLLQEAVAWFHRLKVESAPLRLQFGFQIQRKQQMSDGRQDANFHFPSSESDYAFDSLLRMSPLGLLEGVLKSSDVM